MDKKENSVINQLKNNIKILIENGSLQEAKEFLVQYKNIAYDDIEIYSMQAVISMQENKYHQALDVLLEGLKIMPTNFDIVYNIAYAYEQIRQYDEAVEFYEKACKLSSDEEIKLELDKRIKELLEKYKNIIKKQYNKKAKEISKTPLVSVCIPVYNGERFIRYTIDSVINQTYKNLEIIICDNCSTDDTVKIVESYDDKRIKLYRNESNRGLRFNANKCIELSNGKYIKFVFADDTINKKCIQEMVYAMEKNPDVTLCGVNFVNINEHNVEISQPILNMSFGKYKSKIIFKSLIINGNVIGCPSSVMIRKEALKRTGMFPEVEYAGDYCLWIMLCKVGSFYFINKKYMCFRVQNKSITSQQISTIKRVRDFYHILSTYIDYINFTEYEIQEAYKNANNRSYYSLNNNKNLNEKIEIVDFILNNSKYIPENEKMELINFKNRLSQNLN